MNLLLAGLVIAGIGGALALSLAFANRKLSDFGDSQPNSTNPKLSDNREKLVARLACAGGSNVAWTRARYEGLGTCRAAALVGGGGKGCAWGCLGLGDCARICEFGAITMNLHGLPVVNESKCTACGDCVTVCPKQLFSIHPISHRLWVACKSLQHGEAAEAECEVACNGCGRCAADAPGVLRIEDNLAVVDYTMNHAGARDAIQRCPTGAIVWIDEKLGPVKGAEAKHITRKSSLPVKPKANGTNGTSAAHRSSSAGTEAKS